MVVCPPLTLTVTELDYQQLILYSCICVTKGKSQLSIVASSLVPGVEEERLVHTDALPVN